MITTHHTAEVDLHGVDLLVEYVTTELETGHWWEPHVPCEPGDRWVSDITRATHDGQDVALSEADQELLLEKLGELL